MDVKKQLCDCGGAKPKNNTLLAKHITTKKHRLWISDNKVFTPKSKQQRQRENRQKTKDIFYNCSCGDVLNIRSKDAHEKTIRHITMVSGVARNSIRCECAGFYTINNKDKHFKTRKHIYFIINKALNAED